jgi:CRISPR-associated protein Cas1
MTTLWLDHRDVELRIEPGSLVPYVSGQRQRPVPLRLLERVVIMGNCRLSASVLGALAEAGVAVSVLSPRKSRRRAWLMGPGHNDATLRLLQLKCAADEQFRLAEAHRLIQAKVRRQLALVQDMQKQRPDAGRPLKRAADILNGILASLQAAAPQDMNLDALRGLEGSASRAQFDALAAVLPPSLNFAGRRRRPPPDPVNALLSLSYILLHHRAAQTAWACGLDPLLGFFHEPAFGRESLAADLMEPWRPEIDRWVWRMLATRTLRREHFHSPSSSQEEDDISPAEENGPPSATPCYLGKAGRRIFYEAFERDLAPLFRALRLQVRALIRRLREAQEPEATNAS